MVTGEQEAQGVGGACRKMSHQPGQWPPWTNKETEAHQVLHVVMSLAGPDLYLLGPWMDGGSKTGS